MTAALPISSERLHRHHHHSHHHGRKKRRSSIYGLVPGAFGMGIINHKPGEGKLPCGEEPKGQGSKPPAGPAQRPEEDEREIKARMLRNVLSIAALLLLTVPLLWLVYWFLRVAYILHTKGVI